MEMKKQASPIYLTGFSDESAEDFSEQLQYMQEFGIRYIEIRNADGINVADLTKEKREEIRLKLENAGIKISSIGSPIGKISIEDPFEPHFESFKRVCGNSPVSESPLYPSFQLLYSQG